MPTYDYSCKKCEHTFEARYKISDRKLPEEQPCPKCGQENCIEQVIMAAAICGAMALGLIKPKPDFVERMSQIKESHKRDRVAKIKDY